MALISNESAVGIINKSAVSYKENLLDKNVLFVTKDDNKVLLFETQFLDRNFMHLTGVKSDFEPESFSIQL